ncbi:MAG: ribosome-binding factor A [Candidatus Aminicenantes bacterium RBG_16_63_14]|nr:MAG: ribosome-binding factor A [Candidatus Aminicenantes bacterium RBG_16_63_14]OGD27183.1 MAG: ribosome-binding factor A [Candidatus Aminicenantes bacterium RBG_19FT_COMBO_65_30]
MSEKSFRTRRVAELVQAELSRLLIGEFQDSASGFLTVTRVEMTPDLLTARVFLSVFGTEDPGALLDRIDKSKGYIRRTLASRVKLKYNPQLFFALDPGPEHQERIDKLIEEAKRHGR